MSVLAVGAEQWEGKVGEAEQWEGKVGEAGVVVTVMLSAVLMSSGPELRAWGAGLPGTRAPSLQQSRRRRRRRTGEKFNHSLAHPHAFPSSLPPSSSVHIHSGGPVRKAAVDAQHECVDHRLRGDR